MSRVPPLKMSRSRSGDHGGGNGSKGRGKQHSHRSHESNHNNEEARSTSSRSSRRSKNGGEGGTRHSLAPTQSYEITEQEIEQAIEAGELPLENSWVFWFDGGMKPGMDTNSFQLSMKQVGAFNTIQQFWRYWTHLSDVSQFPKGSNMRMFKKGIQPTWEHPRNQRGGKWIMHCKKEYTAEVWNEVVLAVIGEQLDNSEDLCGVVLSMRQDRNVLSVWNASGRDTVTMEIVGRQLHALFDTHVCLTTDIDYQMHRGALEFNRYLQRHNASEVNQELSEKLKRNREIREKMNFTGIEGGLVGRLNRNTSGDSTSEQESPRPDMDETEVDGKLLNVSDAEPLDSEHSSSSLGDPGTPEVIRRVQEEGEKVQQEEEERKRKASASSTGATAAAAALAAAATEEPSSSGLRQRTGGHVETEKDTEAKRSSEKGSNKGKGTEKGSGKGKGKGKGSENKKEEGAQEAQVTTSASNSSTGPLLVLLLLSLAALGGAVATGLLPASA